MERLKLSYRELRVVMLEKEDQGEFLVEENTQTVVKPVVRLRSDLAAISTLMVGGGTPNVYESDWIKQVGSAMDG